MNSEYLLSDYRKHLKWKMWKLMKKQWKLCDKIRKENEKRWKWGESEIKSCMKVCDYVNAQKCLPLDQCGWIHRSRTMPHMRPIPIENTSKFIYVNSNILCRKTNLYLKFNFQFSFLNKIGKQPWKICPARYSQAL